MSRARSAVFLSHTAELAKSWGRAPLSYLDAAESAVSKAGAVIVEMDHFAAGNRPTAEAILQQVRESDVYVLIAGFRYGSPSREDPLRSHVEIEYDEAERLDIPRLAFLISEYAEGTVQELVDREYGDRQERFRDRAWDGGRIAKKVLHPYQLELELFHALLLLRGHSDSGPAAGIAAVCRALAGVAPDQAREAQEMMEQGKVPEALALLDVAITRLRAVYPAEPAEEGRSRRQGGAGLRALARGRADEAAIRQIADEYAHRLRTAVEQVVRVMAEDVDAMVNGMEPTAEPGLFARRFQVQALLRELNERAADQVTARLRLELARAFDLVAEDVSQDLRLLLAEVTRRVDEEISRELPVGSAVRPAIWTRNTEQLHLDLALTGTSITVDPVGPDDSGGIAGLIESVLGRAAAIDLFPLAVAVRALGDDLFPFVFKEDRVWQEKVRMIEQLRKRLTGPEFRSRMHVVSEAAVRELEVVVEGAVEAAALINATPSDPEVRDWLDGHIAVRRELVERAAAELARIVGEPDQLRW